MNQWDERYNKNEYHYGTEPNEFLREQVAPLLARWSAKQPARILCLADGEGRNSVYLAELGAEVTSLDISQVGLDKALRLAESRGVTIQTQLADLTESELPVNHYDGVVMIFCHLPSAARPRLYQQIEKALKPGGWLLAECYTEAQLGRGTGGPPSADLMLSLNELKNAFSHFAVEHGAELVRSVTEGEGHSGEGAVCQYLGYKRPLMESV
ncbi:SAM-dependent methyltransferase [Aliidiomarina minuta]|uniref:SAM-dependent methyltransferase n=1 Tax=Aliidiomarina minuta TaxID=880057 RepID=A0A432W4L5_9GAMM|nr:class I SAM-dependent methyltransferase [Aliidiomarina minuta]RUO24426.1 SAM-dependent methyltransferase [Aliidiomarina minuta]